MDITPFSTSPRDSTSRGDCIARRLRRAAVFGAIALALAGCGEPAGPPVRVAPLEAAARARQVQAIDHTPVAANASLHFMTFALNALLVPLLDDDMPPRWADPSLSFDCHAGHVTVDDAPLDVGAPVPEGRFIVKWRMEGCTPFFDGTVLTGDVELAVEASADGYVAVVQPKMLLVDFIGGREVLNERFTARMGLGR